MTWEKYQITVVTSIKIYTALNSFNPQMISLTVQNIGNGVFWCTRHITGGEACNISKQ